MTEASRPLKGWAFYLSLQWGPIVLMKQNKLFVFEDLRIKPRTLPLPSFSFSFFRDKASCNPGWLGAIMHPARPTFENFPSGEPEGTECPRLFWGLLKYINPGVDRQLVSLLKSTLKAGLAPVSCQHGFYSGATYRPECPVGRNTDLKGRLPPKLKLGHGLDMRVGCGRMRGMTHFLEKWKSSHL